MHGTMFPHGQFTQSLQVTEVVRFTKEARLAIVAPLDHVLGDTRDVQARLAWHGAAPVMEPQHTMGRMSFHSVDCNTWDQNTAL